MILNRSIARKIVDHLAKTVEVDIAIVGPSNMVLASSRSTDSDAPAELNSIRMPLQYENQEVGHLIIGNGTGYGHDAVEVTRSLVELIIHHHMASEQKFNRQQALDKYVSDLLHGRFQNHGDTALEDAAALDINLDVPRTVIVVDIGSLTGHKQNASKDDPYRVAAEERVQRQRRRQLLDLAHRYLGANSTNIYSFFDEQYLVILAAMDADTLAVAYEQIKTATQLLLDELSRAFNGLFCAGIGEYAASWQQLPHSYLDACFALRTREFLESAGKVITLTDLGLAGFICANNDAIKSELAKRMLHPLLDKPELLETLEIFLEADLATGLAAERLHMHRHGLTYRLRKIHELTGLDPSAFHDAVQLAAALQWQQFTQPDATFSLDE